MLIATGSRKAAADFRSEFGAPFRVTRMLRGNHRTSGHRRCSGMAAQDFWSLHGCVEACVANHCPTHTDRARPVLVHSTMRKAETFPEHSGCTFMEPKA